MHKIIRIAEIWFWGMLVGVAIGILVIVSAACGVYWALSRLAPY